MGLRDKYDRAIQTAKGRFFGGAEERDGKLYWKGTVHSEADKNLILDALKATPGWEGENVTDIQVTARTYTVQSGDTLSKIAKEHLGNANAYMKIFELNKDQLSDPDKIKPGQVLKLP